MTTVYEIHKCWTFSVIGFTPRIKHEFTGKVFHEEQYAIDYCNAKTCTDSSPITQVMTTEFYYITTVKV